MQVPDFDERHTFVIKLWQEGGENGDLWRGHISHVASKQGAYFHQLPDIQCFIAPYLHNKEGRLSPSLVSRLRRWLQELQLRR
jgi:hypothetical protein